MRHRESGAAALMFALAAAAPAAASPPAGAGEAAGPGVVGRRAHTVTIEDMRYDPQTISVRRGDRITWINRDLVPHTVTATDRRFDSHLIQPGSSWTYVAGRAGEYHYRCTLHVSMKGRILVR